VLAPAIAVLTRPVPLSPSLLPPLPHPPLADTHAVVAPGIVEHVGDQTCGHRGDRRGRPVEQKVLDIRNDPDRHACAVRPPQRLAVDDGRIRITVLLLGGRRSLRHSSDPCALYGLTLWPTVRRYCSVSSSETTSAYLASRSNRLCSWAAADRSPTASRTTIGRSPVWTASTAVARTKPLVVQPTMIR